MKQLRVVLGAVALALMAPACSLVQQPNLAVQGDLTIASATQCERYARQHPDSARATLNQLMNIQSVSVGCVSGLTAGLAPTPVPTP